MTDPFALVINERVLHRCRDMFAKIVDIEHCANQWRALIKYEWPYRPDAKPEWVSLVELEPAAGLNPDGTRDY